MISNVSKGFANPEIGTSLPETPRTNMEAVGISGEDVRPKFSRLRMKQSRTLEERIDIILSHYTVSDSGCWNWLGPVNSGGYGIAMTYIDRQKRQHRAHRLSYMAHKGDIPDGAMILHHCDNRLCINPEHLYAGDAKDNARDALERGRRPQNMAKR